MQRSSDAGRPVQSDDRWQAHLWVCKHERFPDSPGQGSEAQQHSLGQLPAHVCARCRGAAIRARQPPQNQHPLQAHPGQLCDVLFWAVHVITCPYVSCLYMQARMHAWIQSLTGHSSLPCLLYARVCACHHAAKQPSQGHADCVCNAGDSIT